MGGSAVLNAASNFMKLLREAAATRLGCTPADVQAR